MTKKRPILDHGYLMLVEHWGSDESIITAARMSTGKGFLGWGPLHSEECRQHKIGTSKVIHCEACCEGKPGDEKLLRYLWEHKHDTPFEVCGMTVEVKCPIVVIWQWVRHRTMSYNIFSGRYSEMPDEFYVPSVERLMMKSKANKQAGTVKGAEELTEEFAELFQNAVRSEYECLEATYQESLRKGVPKELARLILPFGLYSSMRVSANLRSWLAFLTLRMAEDAQWEIQEYARAVGELVAEKFPRTWALFQEGKV